MRWSKETTQRLPPRCEKRTDLVMDITSGDQDGSLNTNPSLAESPGKYGAVQGVGWYMANVTSVQDSYWYIVFHDFRFLAVSVRDINYT